MVGINGIRIGGRMRNIKYIVIHATGTSSDTSIDSIKNYWFNPKNKGGLGWKTGGYHYIIKSNGEIINMYGLNTVTNGVYGFNQNSVHISYIGGKDGVDTRTDEQKESILKVIKVVYSKLRRYQDVSSIKIRGHRDFSDDLNGNNIIDPWERIKECPCFDAIEEYGWIQGNEALKDNKLR